MVHDHSSLTAKTILTLIALAALSGLSGCRPEPRRPGSARDPEESRVQIALAPNESQALKAIDSIGPAATTDRAARTYLIRALRDTRPAVVDRASYWLAKAGEAAVPALISALSETGLNTRVKATYTLGVIGPPAANALPALTTQLGGENDSVANMSDWAISQIQPRGGGFVPLLRALRYGDKFERAGAARQLSIFGEASADAIPLLARGLQDPDPQVGQASGEALVGIGPRASAAVQGVLSSPNPTARLRATLVLSRMRSSYF